MLLALVFCGPFDGPLEFRAEAEGRGEESLTSREMAK